MSTAITVARRAVQLTGMTQVLLGLLLWTGITPGVRTPHMIIGMGFVLALWALAGLVARTGRGRGLAAATAALGLVLPVFGLLHPRLLPGSGHWMIRLVHLALGLAGMALAARLARAARGSRSRQPARDRGVSDPQVVFPLLDRHGHRAYAGEPDEPRFTEIVREDWIRAGARQDPVSD